MAVDETAKALEAHFALAYRWGCILHIDDADVLFEDRQRRNLKQNVIVTGMIPTY